MTATANDRKVLLVRLLVADRELEIRQHNIREVSEMLASGWITPEGALYWLWSNGVDLSLAAAELEEAA